MHTQRLAHEQMSCTVAATFRRTEDDICSPPPGPRQELSSLHNFWKKLALKNILSVLKEEASFPTGGQRKGQQSGRLDYDKANDFRLNFCMSH